MRLDALRIPAFGPFTDLHLEFPARKADLHVMYGPNEAGKSSLLRAIGDLLFEIPLRSTDNFLHDHKLMRLGADIRSHDGRTLSIQRRKGSKNTLLGADDAPLPDDALSKWLGHVDREYFTTMFGLASTELRKGAEELLRGEGDLGKALFSASLGGTPVHKIQESLEDSARLLFAKKAKSSLRASATAYNEELKLSKDSLVKAEDWDAIERELNEATQRQATIDQRRQELQKRCDWIQRCLDALPALGKLQAKEQAIAGLPAMPQVPANFVQDARIALQTQRQMETELRRCREEVERLQSLVAKCLPREEVLARETEIETLHQAFSVYKNHCERLVQQEAKIAAQEPELRASMRDLGIAGDIEILESCRLTAAEMARVKELADEVIVSQQQREAHARALRDKEAAISQLQSKLSRITTQEVTLVREALAQSAAAAEAQRTLDQAQTELARAEREMRSQQRLLVGVPADAASVHDLRPPSKASANALQAAFEDLRRSSKTAENEKAEAAKELAKIRRELAQLERRGALPSVKDLAQVREQREIVWRKIVEQWNRGDADGSESLVRLHEEAQKRADGLADELREHADQVAKADQLRDSMAEMEEVIASLVSRQGVLDHSLQEWQVQWSTLWQAAGIEPRSPEEMSEWRDLWLEFCRQYERWQSLSEAVVNRQTMIAAAEQRLREALNDSQGRAFVVLLDEAGRLVNKASKDQGSRAVLEQELFQAGQDREHLHQQNEALGTMVEARAKAWREKAKELRLTDEISPSIGVELVRRRRELVQGFDGWTALQNEVKQLRQHTQIYEQELTALSDALGFPTATVNVLDGLLWRALNESREARNTLRKLNADLDAARDKEREWIAAGETASSKLSALIKLAALADEAGLEPMLVTLETLFKLTNESDQLRDSLHGPARGESLESFIAKVQMENADDLQAEKNAIEAELAGLETQRHEAVKAVIEAGQRQAALRQAGDTAAMHRQRAESHAASLRTDAARYLRLRLATHFLSQQIERFRQENQAPLMKRASALFQAMTLNRFDGLTTDFTDNDTQVIVGHRGDGNVPVSGMSEGTRDQLYLALRLAAIERHIEVHEPLPLVLDDLLMTFDDNRAAAVLPVLRDLSQKTQVLLFTHHEHLIELCQRTLGEGEFVVHRLG